MIESRMVHLSMLVDEMERMFDLARHALATEVMCDPELARDTAGRFVLLDAMTSIVNARVSLLTAEAAVR